MCIQGMHWGLGYILQEKSPITFEEFPTRAHDIELSIASNGHQGLPVQEKQDCHKGGKFPFKAENKQSLIVITAPFKVPFKPKMKEEKSMHAQDKGKRKLKLQEMQNT